MREKLSGGWLKVLKYLRELDECESGGDETDDGSDFEPSDSSLDRENTSDSCSSDNESSELEGPSASAVSTATWTQVGTVLLGRDNTEWTVIGNESKSGRFAEQNVLKGKMGPTGYAKRSVFDGSVSSAWRLFVDESMLCDMKDCTETEARRRSERGWAICLDELDAFIGMVYARGAYSSANLDLNFLWSTTWGPAVFRQTMPRDRFRQILRYLRFYVRSTRSVRLQTDKFALASGLWNRFIENCIACYSPGENLC